MVGKTVWLEASITGCLHLFDERLSNPTLMAVIDKINARWGAGTVFLASYWGN
ncbi:DUF4113 domain-containing protein [Cytophagaceae bacterium DM2B3-1]|uniref:DUF4113 domain-containing protein n=1 Tax=Xanthocytophaga flava TaxID=3048013 RepID=A0ABT7CMK4_9BACT|nr:DUF4113 domain-containing protein [Xanthocytophaga flavus]MDJ1494988.1 DUF4113 domain-containing protein [Xanthocytophaga flavus]